MLRIAIHGVPRSGTTWLGQIFNSSSVVAYKYQPLFSYAFKDHLSAQSMKSDIVRFFNEIAASDDPFLNQTEAIERGICPAFQKAEPVEACVYKEVRYHHIIENLLAQDPSIHVVGLVRNPLGVMSSWKLAPKEFDPSWDFDTEWRDAPAKNQGRLEEFYGYNKWKEVALLFDRLATQYAERFQVVKYDDLLKDPLDVTRSLFASCEITLEDQTKSFLKSSRASGQSDPYSVFKLKSNDDSWKASLPSSIVDEILDDLKGTQLSRFVEPS